MREKTTPPSPEESEGLRLDIWLWRARFFKSRTLSATTIKKGRIRLMRFGMTRKIEKPHFIVLPQDELIFMRGETLEHIKIIALGTRRGPAREAQELYTSVLTTTQ